MLPVVEVVVGRVLNQTMFTEVDRVTWFEGDGRII